LQILETLEIGNLLGISMPPSNFLSEWDRDPEVAYLLKV
jgi:hypothetical protein